MEHTPGPWHAFQDRPDRIYILRMTYTGEPIWPVLAVVICDEVQTNQCAMANARLIAAAPNLLEALKGLYEHTRNNHQIAGLNTAAREALAKVQGDESSLD